MASGIVDKLLIYDQALAAVDALRADVGRSRRRRSCGCSGRRSSRPALGIAIILGVLTRFSAVVGFAVLTLALFALPDDPVIAHVGAVRALIAARHPRRRPMEPGSVGPGAARGADPRSGLIRAPLVEFALATEHEMARRWAWQEDRCQATASGPRSSGRRAPTTRSAARSSRSSPARSSPPRARVGETRTRTIGCAWRSTRPRPTRCRPRTSSARSRGRPAPAPMPSSTRRSPTRASARRTWR